MAQTATRPGAVMLLEDSTPKKSGPSAVAKLRTKMEGEKEEIQQRHTKVQKTTRERVKNTGCRVVNTAETLVTVAASSYAEGRLGKRMEVMGRDPRPVGAVILLGVGLVRSLGGHKDASHEVAVGTGLAASSIASWARDAGQQAAAAKASGAELAPMQAQVPVQAALPLPAAATPAPELAGRGGNRRTIGPMDRREPARLPPHLQPRNRHANA